MVGTPYSEITARSVLLWTIVLLCACLRPEVWNELRLNQQLCDGVIHCADGEDFRVHRAILSAVSPFFKALFTNSINGGQPESAEVRTSRNNSTTAVRLVKIPCIVRIEKLKKAM